MEAGEAQKAVGREPRLPVKATPAVQRRFTHRKF